jgi:hypothetical protein
MAQRAQLYLAECADTLATKGVLGHSCCQQSLVDAREGSGHTTHVLAGDEVIQVEG